MSWLSSKRFLCHVPRGLHAETTSLISCPGFLDAFRSQEVMHVSVSVTEVHIDTVSEYLLKKTDSFQFLSTTFLSAPRNMQFNLRREKFQYLGDTEREGRRRSSLKRVKLYCVLPSHFTTPKPTTFLNPTFYTPQDHDSSGGAVV